MQTQQVVSPQKPPRVVLTPPAVITLDSDFYVHPHLTPDTDPCKGRLLRASASIRAGTVVLRDVSYAVVPTVKPSTPDYLLCSNLTCSRSVAIRAEKGVRCPKCCDPDVIWCGRACHAVDHKRHEYECLWLKHKGATLRRQESQYDFITLWHVVRLLAGWSLEIQGASTLPSRSHPCGADFKWGWEAVLMCCDYLDSWPDAQIRHWKRLSETYMDDKYLLPCPLSPGEMLSLICKEETNTFGMYPGITGPLSMVDRPVARGEPYGIGLYPRAAMFNHSCEPNVSHKPDSQGRMIFTAARDISKGDECMITYFDLTVHKSLSSRQEAVREQFRFRCTCDRCLEEEAAENLGGMDTLPFCSI